MTPKRNRNRNPVPLRYITHDELTMMTNQGYTLFDSRSRFGFESAVYKYKTTIVNLVSIYNNNIFMGYKYRQSIRVCGTLSDNGLADFSISRAESMAVIVFEDFLKTKGYYTSVGDVSRLYKRLPEYSMYRVYREILVTC